MATTYIDIEAHKTVKKEDLIPGRWYEISYYSNRLRRHRTLSCQIKFPDAESIKRALVKKKCEVCGNKRMHPFIHKCTGLKWEQAILRNAKRVKFKGRIDNVSVYNRKLSSHELAFYQSSLEKWFRP